jgi:flavodoxin
MKIAILYGSSYGKTRAVVKRVVQGLSSATDIYDVKDRHPWDLLLTHDLFLFFCPSYGDEELQSDMEEFFRNCNLDLTERWFVVCELGNYYGYDNFSFGPLSIIRDTLLERGGVELCEPLSLDSFPRTHWGHLDKWVGVLNGKIYDHL